LVYIYNSKPEFIELLDKGILTVNQSYLQIQREEKEFFENLLNLDFESKESYVLFDFSEPSEKMKKYYFI
jgi:hypothetical protein